MAAGGAWLRPALSVSRGRREGVGASPAGKSSQREEEATRARSSAGQHRAGSGDGTRRHSGSGNDAWRTARRGRRHAGGDGSDVQRSAPKKRSGDVHRVWRTMQRSLVGGKDEAEAVTRWGSCSVPCEATGGGAVAPHRRDSIGARGRLGAVMPSGMRSGGAKCTARCSFACQGYDVAASSAQASRSAQLRRGHGSGVS
jgi:hypothetical protein